MSPSTNNPHKLYRYGTLLIWLGVLVWAPYFGLRLNGDEPSLMAYLPFHLAGVLGGARLRSTARKEMGLPKPERKGYKRVAHWIVIASILVWLPYYVLTLAGRPVEITPYLALHLTGIFSGTGLMAAGAVVEAFKAKKNGVADDIGYSDKEA